MVGMGATCGSSAVHSTSRCSVGALVGEETNRNWQQMLEVKTNPGMTTSLTLSDGTVVFLNSESHLTYPSHFNGDTRNVTLQGEAYFEVAKNPEKNSSYLILRNFGSSRSKVSNVVSL